MKILALLPALLAGTSAWSFSCPSLSIVDNFDPTLFSGVWYNQYSKNTPYEAGSCLVSNYTYNRDTGVLDIASSLKTVFNTAETMHGTAVLADPTSGEGRLNLTYSTPIGNMNFDLLVLDTDYNTYTVMFSCTKLLLMPYETTWILTREQTLDDASLTIIQDAMAEIAKNGGPSFSELKKDSQTNCS